MAHRHPIPVRRLKRSTSAGYLCIVAALALALLVTGWGALRGLSDVRRTTLTTEISRLRSHAIRTVGRIESFLEERPAPCDLASVGETVWLAEFWKRVVPRERQRLYAALVSADGTILTHSDPTRAGKRLERRWFDRVVAQAGEDVVLTQSAVLTSGEPAYDIRIPIEVNGKEIGAYHSGFDAAWMEEEVRNRRSALYGRWVLMGTMIAAIVLAAGVSLFYLARRTAALQQALAMAHTQQLAELGRLAGALAHEVRNPLNAIRLNLHSVDRYIRDGTKVSPDEMVSLVRESNEEIERVEALVRTILGYARPDRARVEEVDLRGELDASVEFIRQLVERDGITVCTQFPDDAVIVRADRDRFRQLVLNLLNNAREAVGRDGAISVCLDKREGWADLSVKDSGPGIPPDQRDHIFEPFHTTKDRGCGLGLTLVRRFAEEAGGTVTCEDRAGKGARFRVCLPLSEPSNRRLEHAT
ncbi:MAG: HAMP domain-containing sensor histidine kinase [Phycisphaerae bacterium]